MVQTLWPAENIIPIGIADFDFAHMQNQMYVYWRFSSLLWPTFTYYLFPAVPSRCAMKFIILLLLT